MFSRTARTTKPEKEHEFFGGRRESGRRDATRGTYGPQEGVWRGQGLGRATWPPRPRVDPLVSHRYFLMAFYLENFILNFLGNFTVENFSKFKKLQKLS